MSDLEDTSQVTSKITSSNVEKIKDPKRVEQGKKLATISEAAKEKKAREKFESEAAADRALAMESSWSVDYGYVVGTVGVLTAVGALYFAYRQDRARAVGATTLCERKGSQEEQEDALKVQERAVEASRIEIFD